VNAKVEQRNDSRSSIMTSKNETNSQNPTTTSTPAMFDRKADKRPDLGNSVEGSGGGEQEQSKPTGMIPETARIDPNNTNVPTSNEEGDDLDTVPGMRTAAGSDE
jgi:hypothetical protein